MEEEERGLITAINAYILQQVQETVILNVTQRIHPVHNRKIKEPIVY